VWGVEGEVASPSGTGLFHEREWMVVVRDLEGGVAAESGSPVVGGVVFYAVKLSSDAGVVFAVEAADSVHGGSWLRVAEEFGWRVGCRACEGGRGY